MNTFLSKQADELLSELEMENLLEGCDVPEDEMPEIMADLKAKVMYAIGVSITAGAMDSAVLREAFSYVTSIDAASAAKAAAEERLAGRIKENKVFLLRGAGYAKG